MVNYSSSHNCTKLHLAKECTAQHAFLAKLFLKKLGVAKLFSKKLGVAKLFLKKLEVAKAFFKKKLGVTELFRKNVVGFG